MSTATLDIIRNTEVIAVNQDWGGSQGRRVRDFARLRSASTTSPTRHDRASPKLL